MAITRLDWIKYHQQRAAYLYDCARRYAAAECPLSAVEWQLMAAAESRTARWLARVED